MKCKKLIAGLAALAVLGTATSAAYALGTNEMSTQDLPYKLENSEANEVIDVPVELDQSGSLELDDSGLDDSSSLLDFVFPSSIQGTEVTTIGAGAFQGCELFRTVTIPESITEIGENAFADCPNLEYIILADRVDDEGMTLGENWSGDAAVIFELDNEQLSDEETATLEPPQEAAPSPTEAPEASPDPEPTEMPPAESEPAESPEEGVDNTEAEPVPGPQPQPEESEERGEDTPEPDVSPAPTESEEPDEEDSSAPIAPPSQEEASDDTINAPDPDAVSVPAAEDKQDSAEVTQEPEGEGR